MAELIISMLPVGQGAMNLIEVYADNSCTQLISLSLIDCGAVSTRREECQKSMQYVVERMRQRELQGDGKVFDLVMFTHRDRDHWNLFTKLFDMKIGQKFRVEDWKKGIDQNEWYMHFEEEIDEEISMEDNYYWHKQRPFPFDCTHEFERIVYGDDFFYRIQIEHFETKYSVTINYYNESTGFNISTNWLSSMWSNTVTVYSVDLQDPLRPGSKSRSFTFLLAASMLYWIHWPYVDAIIPFSYIPEKNWAIEEMIFAIECKYIFQNFKLKDDKLEKVQEIAHKEVFRTKEDIENIFTDEGVAKVKSLITYFVTGGNINQQTKTFLAAFKMAVAMSEDHFEAIADKYFRLGNGLRLYIVERIDISNLQAVEKLVEDGERSENNATSAVSLLWDEISELPICLFTGDATCHTFCHMLERLEDYTFLNNLVWTAPHHGAYRTIKGRCYIDGEEEDMLWGVLYYMAPQTIVISAGYGNGYGHPHGTFIKKAYIYFDEMVPECDEHDIFYNANNKSNAIWWHGEYNAPIYTCVYYDKTTGKVVYRNYHFKYNEGNLKLLETLDIIHSQDDNIYSLQPSEPLNQIPDDDMEKNLLKTEVPDKQLFWRR